MKNRALLIGLTVSLVGHLVLLFAAGRLERPDPREQIRTVKLRMVKKAKDEREEKARQKQIEEALKKLTVDEDRTLKEADPEDLKKVKEAQEKLAEIRKKLAEEAAKRQEELAQKKAEEKKPEPKPEPVPEVKPEPKAVEAESKPADKPKDKPKKKKRRPRKAKPDAKAKVPAPGEKPAPPTPELAGAQKGAAIDLDYAMKGGTNSGAAAGSSVSVQAGDGMDIPEEGYNDDPETALSEQPAGDEVVGEDGEEFQEEQQEAAEEAALPDEDGKIGPGAGPIAGKKKKDPRARKVKTTSKHRVTRDAKMIRRISPKYPDEVRALEIQGRVYVLVTVDKAGKVADVTLKKGLHPVLDKVAMEAAWKLEFEPALKDDEPVGVKITVPFLFVLE